MERKSRPKRPRLSVSRRRRQDWSPEALPDGGFSRPPRHQPRDNPESEKLYRVSVVAENVRQGRVKVHYIGYGHEYDEWRPADEVIDLMPGRQEDVENESTSGNSERDDDEVVEASESDFKPLNLYKELASKIKSSLISSRRRDPVCRVELGFDAIYFEGLVKRARLITKSRQSTRQTYSIDKFSKLEEILGRRWYIRGLNLAGDFCYVKPGSVIFYLMKRKVRVDYQLEEDGTIKKYPFGGGYQLVFKFVRGDGIHTQWDSVRRSCS